MRSFSALAILIPLALSGLPSGAAAQSPDTIVTDQLGEAVGALPDAEAPQPQDRAARLEKLFGDLKRERNPRGAERIANFIREEWARSGSASIDLLMQWSSRAIEEKKYDAALDFLDQVTMLEPDFAEGWNRRATVHYMMNSYAKSMSDIERALRLEPRHFGALSGMAEIFKAYGRKQAAMDAYGRVLSVYPALRPAQQQLGTLADELAGQGI